MWDDLFDSIGSWFSEAADSVSNAVSSGWNAVTGAASSVPDWSVESLSNLGDAPSAGLWDVSSYGDAPMAGTWATAADTATPSWSVDTMAPLGDAPSAGKWTSNSSVFGDIGEDIKTKVKGLDWGSAGLKLGAQALGSLATSSGSKAMASYLNDVKALESQAQNFNLGSAGQKNALATQLATDGTAINPAQYAQNQLNATKNRDAAAWAETEARMRANGYSDDAINAERNRAGLISSQNQGTAYDSGMQTGTQTRNSTLGTAGSLYTQVSTPSAGLASAYSSLNNADRQAKTDAGNAIEQAFGIVNSTTKKPS